MTDWLFIWMALVLRMRRPCQIFPPRPSPARRKRRPFAAWTAKLLHCGNGGQSRMAARRRGNAFLPAVAALSALPNVRFSSILALTAARRSCGARKTAHPVLGFLLHLHCFPADHAAMPRMFIRFFQKRS
ncbi:hypothetical protein E3U26_22920 (plasmid) [Paracoccus ferrooxidans]|nr:hypothetical protein E3U26_22920 [Paracoccus ferrooxidans]